MKGNGGEGKGIKGRGRIKRKGGKEIGGQRGWEGESRGGREREKGKEGNWLEMGKGRILQF